MRRLILLSASLIVLASCGRDIVAPNRDLGGSGAAARATSALSLTATPNSASQITLSWNDIARNETGWEIQRGAAEAGPFTVAATVGANSTSYADGERAALTQYCYRVRSFRTLGKNTQYEAFSNIVCARTFGPPDAPTGLIAVAQGSRSVSVSWDHITTLNGYRLERAPDPAGNWQEIAQVSSSPSNYVDYGVTPGARVCYRVRGVNQYGVGAPSNVDCALPPAPPTSVTAALNGSAVDVTWTDNSGVAEGYQLYRSGYFGGPDSNIPISTLDAAARIYHDAAALPDGGYYYWVRAIVDGVLSEQINSNIVTIATAPPTAPVIDAYAAGSTIIVVSVWTSSGTAETIRVQRSSDGVSGWTDAFTGSIWSEVRDTDRAPEQRVCYRAYASNRLGESPASDVDCTIPLARATDLRVTTDPNTGDLTATWTDNSQHEQGYIIRVWDCWSYYECYLTDLDLGPDATTSTVPGYYSGIGDVLAYGDGGSSDPAVWASDASASGASTSVRQSGSAQSARLTAHRTSLQPSTQRLRCRSGDAARWCGVRPLSPFPVKPLAVP